MRRILGVVVALAIVAVPGRAQADEVTDWNQALLVAGLMGGTAPTTMTRMAALVQVAVFDAVNGVDPRYASFRVQPTSLALGASKRAAAVQAAYAMLTKLYGSGAATPSAPQQATIEARRTVSLNDIAKHESDTAIAKGVAWGQYVADQVFAWRSTDGFANAPTYVAGTGVGVWRPTPNLPVSNASSAAGAGYVQLSEQTPWAIAAPSAFRPGPPPLLNSAQYATDFNEVKTMGSQTSTMRTADQTELSLFWNSGTVVSLWMGLATRLIDRRDKDDNDHDYWRHGQRHSLLENARLLAQVAVSMADAIIGCWDAKYTYAYWRPVTAIRDLNDDGNPATTPDQSWMPLFATPGHPDYPSGHSCGSGAAATVLAEEFGSWRRFDMQSDTMLGVTRSFRGFDAALREVANARVFPGIHFRTACEVGQQLGRDVAHYVLENKFQRVQ